MNGEFSKLNCLSKFRITFSSAYSRDKLLKIREFMKLERMKMAINHSRYLKDNLKRRRMPDCSLKGRRWQYSSIRTSDEISSWLPKENICKWNGKYSAHWIWIWLKFSVVCFVILIKWFHECYAPLPTPK